MTTFVKAGCCLGAALLLAAMMARGAIADPCPQRTPPYPPQSPRVVNPNPWPGVYNGTPNIRANSLITQIRTPYGDEIMYAGQRLYLCDQHYHVPVENPQGIAGEQTVLPGTQPQPQQWIEMHTVYAAHDSTECRRRDGLDNDLVCCLEAGPPIVVRGFSAKVTTAAGNVQGGGTRPFVPPVGAPLAEWSGSNTGPDKPDEPCKPHAAQWSFLLNRNLTVSFTRLRATLPKVHGARDVQSNDRLSRDLALAAAPAPPVPADESCSWRQARPIWNQGDAQGKCSQACLGATPRWNGRWFSTEWNKPSSCACCPR